MRSYGAPGYGAPGYGGGTTRSPGYGGGSRLRGRDTISRLRGRLPSTGRRRRRRGKEGMIIMRGNKC